MFPINYFRYMWSPRAIFEEQHEFNWLKSTLILVFWSAVMLVPLWSNFTPVDQLSDTAAFQAAGDHLPAETSQIIAEQPFEKGAFLPDSEPFVLEDDDATIGFLPMADNLDGLLTRDGYVLVFLSDSFSYRTPDGGAYGANYPFDFRDHLYSNEAMMDSLLASYQATQTGTQRAIYVMSRHLVFILFGIGGLMIIAANMNRLRREHFWDIYGFERGLAMVTMAAGIPSLLATLAGFFYSHNLLMLAIQIAGTIIMLRMSYKQTGFKSALSKA